MPGDYSYPPEDLSWTRVDLERFRGGLAPPPPAVDVTPEKDSPAPAIELRSAQVRVSELLTRLEDITGRLDNLAGG